MPRATLTMVESWPRDAEFIEKAMKALAILAIAASLTLTSTASADKYGDLVAQGFRWANISGPYACVSKDDVRRMVNTRSDELKLKMVEQVKAYFLTRERSFR